MVIAGSAAEARLTRHPVGGVNGLPQVFRSEWLRTSQDPVFSPTAMLIEQPPFSVLPGHYHRQNEFQVVIAGSGTIGRHVVCPYAVHYAGSYTGYGPLSAGPEGLAYLTMRTVYERGVLVGRSSMIRGPKRQEHVPPFAPGGDVRTIGDVSVDELIPPGEDCLAALRVRLSSGAHWSGIDGAGSAGQFHLVLAGEYALQGRTWGALDLLFHSSGEGRVGISAGARGLDVLIMQMPRRSPVYEAALVVAAGAAQGSSS